MDRLTQESVMQEHSNRECWGSRQDASLGGEWLAQAEPADGRAGADTRMHWLLRTIEAEIIPRLMLAHRSAAFDLQSIGIAPLPIGHDEVVAFAGLALAHPAETAIAHVETLRAEGMALETIYLNLLAPAARHLGEMWQADLCDFTEVTLGLWRLQQVMHELSPAFQNDATYSAQRRRILLATAPGSQHTLGLLMVAEFFRRAGWDVWGEPASSIADLAATVRVEWFDVLGLSVGAEAQVEDLASVILTLRKASRNKSISVMAGGPIFASHPEWVAAIGADATAADAPQAIVQAENLLAQRDRHC